MQEGGASSTLYIEGSNCLGQLPKNIPVHRSVYIYDQYKHVYKPGYKHSRVCFVRQTTLKLDTRWRARFTDATPGLAQ